MTTTQITPTPEQMTALELFGTGRSLAIEAGAGTGKTSTLTLLARSTRARGQYVAFNKAIVTDVEARMPGNVNANTAHSLAMRAVGHRYRHRLNSDRMRSMEIARRLDVDPISVTVEIGNVKEYKTLSPAFLAGLAVQAVKSFCFSDAPEPTTDHVPYIEGIDVPVEGRRTWENNRRVAADLMPYVHKAWSDLRSTNGGLPYFHDAYLKVWALDDPQIPADFLMLDECQDLNPVLIGVAAAQREAQVVLVGDTAQTIYAWRGCRNAFEAFTAEQTTYLTQSFRFGPAIADVANVLLGWIGTPLRLRGLDSISSLVGPLTDPDAILCRTNAMAVQTVMGAQAAGRRPHLVGGGAEVIGFTRGAVDLQAGRRTSHHDLACFDSWGEVQCLSPDARALTEDLRWVPLDLLAVGDRLVGFDESTEPGTGGRRFRTVTVEATREIVQPCARIHFGDGREVVASLNHRWLIQSGHNLRWKTTAYLRPGDAILSLGQPWEVDESREAGWLAGIYDGEGSINNLSTRSRSRAIDLAQREGPVLERARAALKERGFDFGDYGRDHDDVRHLSLRGGIADRLRFLGEIRPERLVAKAANLWEGRRVERVLLATVTAVDTIGLHPTVAMQTSSRTFIGEGLFSHNCYVAEDAQGGDLRLLVGLVDEFGTDAILHALGRMPSEAAADLVVSTAHKAKGREWNTVRLAGDFPDGTTDTPAAEELRLLYVACTRAKHVLDVSANALVATALDGGQ